MTRLINVHEAKTHLSRILEDVRSGDDIVLAKNGVAYARLVAVERAATRPMGFLTGHLPDSFFEPLPDDELDAWDGIGATGE